MAGLIARAGLLLGCATLAALPVLDAAEGSIDVVVSRSGFQPQVVEVRRGDSVSLRLSSADTEHCFAIDALRIEKRVLPGRTTLAEFSADRAGEFPFYCCLEPDNEALRGRLIVRE